MRPKRAPFTPEQEQVLRPILDRLKTLEGRVMGLCLHALDKGDDTTELLLALDSGEDRLMEARTALAVERVVGREEL